MPRAEIIAQLVEHFRSRYGLRADRLTEDEETEAQRRVLERFGTPGWIHVLP